MREQNNNYLQCSIVPRLLQHAAGNKDREQGYSSTVVILFLPLVIAETYSDSDIHFSILPTRLCPLTATGPTPFLHLFPQSTLHIL